MRKFFVLFYIMLSFFLMNTVYAQNSTQDNEKITIKIISESNKLLVTDYDNETHTIIFDNNLSFVDKNGLSYIMFDAFKYFIEDKSVDFKFNPTTGIATTVYKYDSDLKDDWTKVEVSLNSNILRYNGVNYKLSSYPVLKDEKLYLPLRSTLNSLSIKDEDIFYSDDDKSIVVEKKRKPFWSLYLDDSLPQYIVNEDIYYKEKSKDIHSIEKYIKENINSDFNIKDYQLYENENTSNLDTNILIFSYMANDLVSDFAYEVVLENNKVVLITQLGTKISDKIPLSATKISLSDKQLCEMALKELGISDVVNEQTVYKVFDSTSGKVKYTVHTVYGTEETGFYSLQFEHLA